MLSLRTVLFLGCAALAMANPVFFEIRQPQREEFQEEQQLKSRPYPMNQVAPQQASPSYDYGGGDAGGGTETDSESGEVDAGAGGSLAGGATEADAADNEAAENEAAEATDAENDIPDAVVAGGALDAAEPNSLEGGPPGQVKNSEKSYAGQKAGIAVGVVAMVGLAAGIGYFIHQYFPDDIPNACIFQTNNFLR